MVSQFSVAGFQRERYVMYIITSHFGTVSTMNFPHSVSIHDHVPCLCFTSYIIKGVLAVSVFTRGLMYYQDSPDPAL
jgi:hypothetical protein